VGALLVLNVARFVLLGIWLATLARVILSFVDPGGRTRLSSFVVPTTEPLLAPIRRLLPSTGMVDFSPMLLCLVIGVLLRFLL
jgi:YggT family protein